MDKNYIYCSIFSLFMVLEVTVSILELPNGWPQHLKDSGIKMHSGVIPGPNGKPVQVYSPEIRISTMTMSEGELIDLSDRVAKYWGTSTTKIEFIKELRYARITARGLPLEISAAEGCLIVRSTHKFEELPDQKWDRGRRSAIVDATIVEQVAGTIRDILAGIATEPGQQPLQIKPRSDDYHAIFG
jgi:hypothetical protein